MRRLQRKWALDAETYIQKAQEPFREDRWNKEAKALKEVAPELYSRCLAFAKSKGGREQLLKLGDGNQPVHFMSLSIESLNEWLKKTTMHGAKKAQEEFPNTLKHWSNFGSRPDVDFLRAFGKLCQEKADEMEAHQSGISKELDGGNP